MPPLTGYWCHLKLGGEPKSKQVPVLAISLHMVYTGILDRGGTIWPNNLVPDWEGKAMRRTSRRFWVAVAVLLLVSTALPAQQAPAQQQPERVIINFILPVTPDTVNLLLNVVNGQIRNGAKKITIVLSSPGGDPMSAFGAYNILKNVPAEITTFNAGAIDSAAILIYCAGKHRYSLPDPSRFLIHSAALNPMTTSVPVEARWLESQLAQLRSVNAVIAQVIAANSNKKPSEIQSAVEGQVILSPQEAKSWGLVQEIRDSYAEAGAAYVSVNVPAGQEQKEKPQFTTTNPVVTGETKQPIP
jgi:ATP-dependent Clp protease, protease subunit